MRRMLVFNSLVLGTSAVYSITQYNPCQPHPEMLINGLIIPEETCSGPSFDNLLVAVMCLGVLAALIYMLKKTRGYSTRGLGIYALILIFLGTYGRSIVMTRLLGFPPITPYEFRLLRALLTWGAPLFVIGTFAMYRAHPRARDTGDEI